LFDSDPLTSFERLPAVTRSNPFVRSVRIEGTRGLSHFDEPATVEIRLREFYRTIELVARADDQDSSAQTQRMPSVRPDAHA
jgi:hypothetical protein